LEKAPLRRGFFPTLVIPEAERSECYPGIQNRRRLWIPDYRFAISGMTKDRHGPDDGDRLFRRFARAAFLRPGSKTLLFPCPETAMHLVNLKARLSQR
jgi:hypothetical protein